MAKSKYTTQQQRLDFLRWLSNRYGYELETANMSNSRILSADYYKATNVLIPKLTIHRWLKDIETNKRRLYESIASDYINEGLR